MPVPFFEQLESANEAHAVGGSHRSLAVRPARGLAVLTCMDARIDVFAVLGLDLGDAHVLRTAGARVTDDVQRLTGRPPRTLRQLLAEG